MAAPPTSRTPGSAPSRTLVQQNYRRVHAGADRRVPAATRAIVRALDAAHASLTDLDAHEAYAISPETFIRRIDWTAVAGYLGAPTGTYAVWKAAGDSAAAIFGQTYLVGARVAADDLSGYLGATISLSMTSEYAASYAEQRAGTLITAIQQQQLDVVRNVVGQGQREGIDIQRQGRLLRSTVGLNERQARALANYERGLWEHYGTGSTRIPLRGAGRPLADARYSLNNLNRDKINEMVERYRTRLVNYRAEMIARTETMRAANAGTYAEQFAQGAAGLFDLKTAQRIWVTTPDDRACVQCQFLEGQTVGFAEQFVYDGNAAGDPSGDVRSGETPPIHPLCRCTTYLEISIESAANAFAEGAFSFQDIPVNFGEWRPEGWRRGTGAALPIPPYVQPRAARETAAAAGRAATRAGSAARGRVAKPEPEPYGEKGRDPRQAVEYKSKAAEQRFGPVLDEIAKIHGIDATAPVNVVTKQEARTVIEKGAKLKSEGGAFWRRGRQTGGKFDPVPHIRANVTKSWEAPSDVFSFVHEFGHRLDAVYTGDGLSGWYVSEMRVRALPEMTDLLKAATVDSPSFMETLGGMRAGAFKDYWESASEVWARAYSQWMAYRLEATVPEVVQGLKVVERATSYYQWPRAEFEKHIGPKVEKVLRARGLMR